MTLLSGPGALCHFSGVNRRVAFPLVDALIRSMSPEEPSVVFAYWLLGQSEPRDHQRRRSSYPSCINHGFYFLRL